MPQALPQIAVAIVVLASLLAAASGAKSEPRFVGELVFRALPDGRNVELVEDFGYIDATGRQWGVVKGTIVDGASIPQAFWSLIGGPFTGKYRAASVVHDFYCRSKHRNWKAVHKVFYEGMVTSGVTTAQAKLMYYAVYRFGPRWDIVAKGPECPPRLLCMLEPGVGLHIRTETFKHVEADFQEITASPNLESMSLEELERVADRQQERLGQARFETVNNDRRFYRNYVGFPREFDDHLDAYLLREVRRSREEPDLLLRPRLVPTPHGSKPQ